MTPEQRNLVEAAAQMLADVPATDWPAMLDALTPRYLAELAIEYPDLGDVALKENGHLFLAAVTRRLRQMKQGKPQ